MSVKQAIADIQARLVTLNQFVESNRIPNPTAGMADRSIAKTIMDMEIYVNSLINNPPIQDQTSDAVLDNKIKTNIEALIDSKLKTAIAMSKPDYKDDNRWFKSILESKAVQDIGPVVDAKQYRQWNKKMKNAVEQTRQQSRSALEAIERLTEDEINDASKQGQFDSKKM